MGGEPYEGTVMGLKAAGREPQARIPAKDLEKVFQKAERTERHAPLPLGFSSEGSVFRQAMIDGVVRATRGWPL
jgi:hypothetical protein